jgi:acylphosphatase
MHHASSPSNSSDTTTAATLTRHLLIRGHVQGVGYRWSLVQAALQRGVQGWVRNRRDGSVEALATGPADAVQSLIDWARHGPPQARVDGVEVGAVAEPAEPVAGFVQRETV